MPDGVVAVLVTLGVMLLLTALAQYSMADYFGERVRQILLNNGMPRRADKWDRARGQRLSRTFAFVWLILGSVLVLLAIILFVIVGRL